MKKTLAIVLAMLMVFTAVAFSAAADFEATITGSTYEVFSPVSVEFQGLPKDEGHTTIAVPQGGCTLDALADGELIRDASAFSTKGIVLVKNEWIGKNAPAAKQDAELVPDFAFVLDLGEEVDFDTAYFVLYHEIANCIAIPADKKVIVEISDDKKVWAPVGDGEFYFNANVDEFEENVDDKEIVECAVALGEEVSARYVRYTFTFMPVPEDGYWEWHTNIYEWCGFTELGVALWTDGLEQDVIDKEDAEKEPTKVEGKWICDDEIEVLVVEFVNNAGVKTATFTVYDSEEYAEAGLEAEVQNEMTVEYSVLGEKLTLVSELSEVLQYKAVIDEEGDLMLTNEDGDAIILSPYTAPEVTPDDEPDESDPETSTPEESEPEESVPETDESVESTPAEESEDASVEESTSATTESEAETDGDTTSDDKDEGGLDTWVIILIVVAAVAVVAVIVVVVLKKKKA